MAVEPKRVGWKPQGYQQPFFTPSSFSVSSPSGSTPYTVVRSRPLGKKDMPPNWKEGDPYAFAQPERTSLFAMVGELSPPQSPTIFDRIRQALGL